jgi:hypothetical protein
VDSGVGVRISIYFQAIFAILSTVIRFYAEGDGPARGELIKSTFNNSMAIIFTGLAIAISGVIQAATFGLTVYHAILLLNLCWVIILGALVPYFVILYDDASGFRTLVSLLGSGCGLRDLNNPRPDAKYASRLHLLHSLHLTITGCVGLWVFIRLRTFDISTYDMSTRDCLPTPFTVAVIFGYRHLVTSPIYQILSLVLYSMCILPIINVVAAQTVFLFLPWGLTLLLGSFSEKPGWKKGLDHTVGPLSLCLLLGAITLVLVNTEQIIRSNDVLPGEGLWTLGQTLALMAAFIPTIDFNLWLWKKRGILWGKIKLFVKSGSFFEIGFHANVVPKALMLI